MPEVFVLPRGTDRDFPITLTDARTGEDFLLDDTYTLTGSVWIGDDQAPLFAPVVLLDGTPPTANIILRFEEADSEDLEPGDYLLQAYGDVGGDRRALLGDEPCILRITPTAGDGEPAVAWITADDLRGYGSTIDQHLSATSDQTGFREERVLVTELFKRRFVDRYQARPGYARRRWITYDPIHGYDQPEYAVPPPSKAEVRAALDDDRLTVDEMAKEIMARMALALIFGDEITNDPRTNPYTDAAAKGLTRVEMLWSKYQGRMDLDDDGIEDALIDVDVTFLSVDAPSTLAVAGVLSLTASATFGV